MMLEADLLIIDVNIATMDPNLDTPYGAIENAAIAIKDGKINWLGLVVNYLRLTP